MATILKHNETDFQASPNKIDPYQLLTDVSRSKKKLNPENLNFDLRQLNPGQYSAPFHFHRYAEELFFIISGTATLRTPEGLTPVESGDILFFEKGETGAHQLFNHSTQACIYLDLRSYIGYDIAEYPDSEKLLIAPSFEIFRKESQPDYFEGETLIRQRWDELKNR